jgi:uncharacterized damage-inducible protein DinB
MPQLETSYRNIQMIIEIQRDALQRLKDHEAKMDSTQSLQSKLIEEAQSLAKETSRKLQTRVASDTYDYEISYLKNVITSLRGQIEELK